MVEAATNAQIKEIFERNERTVRSDRRKKTVGKAELWVTELDALLERIRTAEADKARLSGALRQICVGDGIEIVTGIDEQRYEDGPFAKIARAALSGSSSGGWPVRCSVKVMNTSAGIDYFVSIERDGRELTPHSFSERWKAEYEVAEWEWLLNGGEKPDLMAYGPLPAAPQQGGE